MATYTSGDQTREILISAAGELAALNGFSNVSIRAVANRAQRNIGSIHYHFKSKQELFKAVIRSATRASREYPPEKVLEEFEGRLHLPEIQAKAIRRMVHRSISVIFNAKKPWWHSRIIYQTMQHKDELWEMLHQELIEPEIKITQQLFKLIKPDLSDEDTFVHTMVMKTPIFFHADNSYSILIYLEKETYSKSYLQKIEDLIVVQTQLLLGLPTDKTLYARTIE
ncbi:TetR/AcrR family transcriptional regulator [Desulfobacula phenolica]|uniref:Transcriptional regulator, TetR family n=1 Tax=Desulfobacula phenolica TaxID=90732 RepID=A0A1H2IG60_9BACT|nr:CerR family C-terminal domain-containing protein [Desulfobacula phenolica]SDU42858.1 transcriptional regulator, TetR family [Desulfobacula phenolica]